MRPGNLIHRINPDVLIMCDGLGYASDLTGVAAHPVRLDHPGRVVYGRHDYPWFHPDHQPREAFFGQLGPIRRRSPPLQRHAALVLDHSFS
jgi:hypothetical protein